MPGHKKRGGKDGYKNWFNCWRFIFGGLYLC